MARKHRNILSQAGAAVVECAVALPFLTILLATVLDLGSVLNQRHAVLQAAREGAYLASRTSNLAPDVPVVCPDNEDGCQDAAGLGAHALGLFRARDIYNLTAENLEGLVYTSIHNQASETVSVTISGYYTPAFKVLSFRLPFSVTVTEPYLMAPSVAGSGNMFNGITLTDDEEDTLLRGWASDAAIPIGDGVIRVGGFTVVEAG